MTSRRSCIFRFAVAAAIFLPCCSNPLWLAHRYNEEGIGKDGKGRYSEARGAFEKSIAFNARQEIPLYNLAGTYFKEKNYPMAHRHFSSALEIEYRFPEALYNDGHALFSWGRGELDRDFCSIERTQQLWGESLGRFEEVIKYTGAGSALGAQAELNAGYVKKQIDFIREKHDENKDRCRGKSGSSGNKGTGKEKKNQNDKDDRNKTGGGEGPQKGVTKKEDELNSDGSHAAGGGGRIDKDLPGGGAGQSGSESDEIRNAIRRIREDSGKNRFNQTRPQQVRSGKGRENIGEKISW